MTRKGIATPKTPAHIENILTLKASAYKRYLEQELDKLVNSTEQEDRTFFFSLKTLKVANLYYT